MRGIYIHVPFCIRKCPYCDFYSVCSNKLLIEDYVLAVIRNIQSYKNEGIWADTVYFGGGTPSLLLPGQISRILDSINKSFKLENAEITMECNPSSVDFQKILEYKLAGVNRLSFGVQSADDKELSDLGRLHSFDNARLSVENAVKAGFDNISCDIMMGLVNQKMASLKRSIDRISSLPINHISAYMLKIEQGTLYDKESIKSNVADEDLISDMYIETVNDLEKKGFKQYEISNFAKDGKYSRHNLKYWQCAEYIGIGPSAHSFYKGTRFACPQNLKAFVDNEIQECVVTDEKADKLEEYIMLGLRLSWGISVAKIENLSDEKFAMGIIKKAENLVKHGLCDFDGERIKLTTNGFLISNEIIGLFLEI